MFIVSQTDGMVHFKQMQPFQHICYLNDPLWKRDFFLPLLDSCKKPQDELQVKSKKISSRNTQSQKATTAKTDL
jgi:hypothetical protein